jgi:hypothetical protein
MWHVDEGALHAYLDGALDEYPAAEARRVREHLDACAECSERLDEERRVRHEAQTILGLAAPRVEVSSFEELRAYVRTQAPRRSAASARLYRLGWAASVVLALGTGWLLRGDVAPTLVRSAPAGLDELEGRAARQEAGAGAAATSGAPDVSTADERRSGEVGAEVGSGNALPMGATGPEAPRGRTALEADAAAPQPPAAPTSPAAAPEAAAPEAERFGAQAGGARSDVTPDAALADATDPARTATKSADDSSDILAANAGLIPPTPAAQTTPAAAASPGPAEIVVPGGARQDTAPPGPQEPQGAAVEPRLVSAITAAGPLRPTAVAPDVVAGSSAPGRDTDADAPPALPTDATEEESVSLVVPGLEVLDVLPVGEGTSFRGMRALQRLQPGDTLELVHLPEGIEPSSLPPLREGWSELVRPRGSGWLVMRAPVSEATLAELLQRLESGR